jgi:hypothetical protein
MAPGRGSLRWKFVAGEKPTSSNVTVGAVVEYAAGQ